MCTQVGGVTHQGSNEKQSVSFSLTLESVDLAIPIDLTVVVSNPPSEFYYTRLFVNVVLPSQSTAQPTSLPPSAPTQAPANATTPTEAPTLLPTLNQSEVTSVLPSTPPSSLPSVAPTEQPTTAMPITSMPTTQQPTTIPTLTPLPTIYELIVQRGLLLAEYVDLVDEGYRPIIDNGEATLTLFAPINEAFEGLHPRLVSWLEEDVFELLQVLFGHTLGEVVSSQVLRTRASLTFLNGQTRSMADDNLQSSILIEGVQIMDADIPANNGVVHTIDRILTIPTLQEYLATANPLLLDYLVTTKLLDNIVSGGGMTLFSPRPAAFLDFAETHKSLGDVIFTEPVFALHMYDVFATHAARGMLFRSDLNNGQTLNTLVGGETVSVTFESPNVTLSTWPGGGVATIVEFDGVTLDAIVHEVDMLLAPSFVQKSLANVVGELTPRLSSLFVLAELEDTLRNVFGLTGKEPSSSIQCVYERAPVFNVFPCFRQYWLQQTTPLTYSIATSWNFFKATKENKS